jgi:crossover junction endodeoxyribonuclease RusA
MSGQPFPFAFVVTGLPISHQSKNRKKLSAWRASVRAAAVAAWPPSEPPTGDDVRLTVVCYFDSTSPDVDNFHKPIQDELEGLVYINDSQVVHALPSKLDINGRYVVRNIPSILARAFELGEEFVHIHVELAADDGKLI